MTTINLGTFAKFNQVQFVSGNDFGAPQNHYKSGTMYVEVYQPFVGAAGGKLAKEVSAKINSSTEFEATIAGKTYHIGMSAAAKLSHELWTDLWATGHTNLRNEGFFNVNRDTSQFLGKHMSAYNAYLESSWKPAKKLGLVSELVVSPFGG